MPVIEYAIPVPPLPATWFLEFPVDAPIPPAPPPPEPAWIPPRKTVMPPLFPELVAPAKVP